jgi:DNA-binding CsgD family transcriptional regulator
MARIEHIEHRLLEWGESRIRQQDGGGRRRVISSIYDGREKVDCTASEPDFSTEDAAAEEIDRAIRALLPSFGKLHETAIEVYWKGRKYSLKINAKRLGVSYATIKTYVEHLHLRIDQWLQEHRQPRAYLNGSAAKTVSQVSHCNA